ncbi:MAG: HlyD family efflux transporter periplasmic adaptor subunit [Myxococcales bacterium]|nr:HlyD family efflux transporter periplasmic adaptor subunit [Myxococcales bacterium]
MKKVLLTLVVVALVGAGGWAGWRRVTRTAAPAEVPTVVVTSERFVRKVTTEGALRAVKATPLSVPQSGGGGGPMKLAWLAEDGSLVKAGEVVIRFDQSEPARALRDGQADLAVADARLTQEQIKSRAAVAGRDATAALAGQELDRTRAFQQKDQDVFSHNQIVESEIDEKLAGARQAHAEQVKQIERSLSRSKAGVIGVERAKAELTITHAKAALERMEVRAPHDGILVLRRGWRGTVPRVGDQLWPGQGVAEIPLLDDMEAEVFVLEVDASGLKEGQPAEVTIEARPGRVFAGKIRLVDKLAKPRLASSPVQYFAVVIELDTTERAVMKPGQRVQSTLTLADEDALVVPRQAVISKGEQNLVYRKGPRGFEPVPVVLGAATAGRVVVKDGLAAGDRIALRDPTVTTDAALAGSGSGSAGAAAGEGAP